MGDRPAAAHAAGEVCWSGFLPNGAALARADGAAAGLSLLTYTRHNRQSLPTKVAEYLARGAPVVTTPNPQAARIVREARAGLAVPRDDPAATLRAVRWLLAHADARLELGAAGHTAARTQHDWRGHAERFVALFADVPVGGPNWPSHPPRR